MSSQGSSSKLKWVVRAVGIVLGLVLAFNDQFVVGLVVAVVAFTMFQKKKPPRQDRSSSARQFEDAMRRRQERELTPPGGRLTPGREQSAPGNQFVPGPRVQQRPADGFLDSLAKLGDDVPGFTTGGTAPATPARAPRPTLHPAAAPGPATPVRQEPMMSSQKPGDDHDNPRLPDISEVGAADHGGPDHGARDSGSLDRAGVTDPYDATPRIDDAPVREMARTNEEMLARSQESMNEMRSRIEAEAKQARAHAAEALAATVSAAGLTAAAGVDVDGAKIRQTADTLPPLSGSGAAREMPWDKPMEFAAGAPDDSGSVVDRLAGELGRRSGTEVFRNVRLADFGTKAPLVVVKGDRAVIIDVVDLPGDGLRWVAERGRKLLVGGTSRSEQPDRIAETITDWDHDNPDADFASVITLAEGSLGSVEGESRTAVNLLDPADVVGTVTDWLADAKDDRAVNEKLQAYLQSRANRF